MRDGAIATNADRVAALFRERAGRWATALSRGLARALALVDGAAQDNLSGAGAPGSYPVPVRTGNLRRSQGMRLLSPTAGLVFNTARYAAAIHGGLQPVKHHGHGATATYTFESVAPRAFLDDAVARVKPDEIIFGELLKAL